MLLAYLPFAGAAGAEPRAVDDALDVALGHPALAAMLAGELGAAEAAIDEAAALAPPTLSLDHEQVLTPEALTGTETSLMIEQTFHPGGWRGALREAAPIRRDAVRAGHDARRLAVATATRRAFYAARHHQLRLAVLDGWQARLDRAITRLEAREQLGDASRFQVERARRERHTTSAERAAEAARLGAAWARLASLTGWTEQATLTGAMRPDPPAAAVPAEPPGVARLRHEARARAVEADAWRGAFGRGWRLGAGYRLVGAGEATGHGVLLSLGVPLALWNPDAPRIARLTAERGRLQAESERLSERAQTASAENRTRLTGALDALDALPADEADARFLAVAESAFGAGEATLETLLDAYDSAARLRLATLELQWQARAAAIDLNHANGVIR